MMMNAESECDIEVDAGCCSVLTEGGSIGLWAYADYGDAPALLATRAQVDAVIEALTQAADVIWPRDST